MIIDAHAHVFMNPQVRYMPGSSTFMSAKNQIAIMDRFGIDKAVILPASNPEAMPECQGFDEVLRICERYPGRFIPYCNVDPRLTGAMLNVDASYFEFILEQYKQAGCKGLGEITAKIYWDDPRVLHLLEACSRVGFPVTFHTSTARSADYGLIDDIGLPRLEKVLQKFLNLVFFGHSQAFWAEISGEVSIEDKISYPTGPVRPGGAVPRLMRTYKNLYADISANSGLGALTRDEAFAYDFINEFHEQIVFGLDYCLIENERHHITWLKMATEKGNISAVAYENIMYRNICRVLNMIS
jgi:uncharacterized protein